MIGMTEYIFYFATVLGVLVLRRRSRLFSVVGAAPAYHTSLVNPLLFCFASAIMVAQSAIAHVMQIVVVFLFFSCGATIYRLSWWQKFVGRVEPEAAR
jgi:predicted tellurium resistance membrane protein TerC